MDFFEVINNCKDVHSYLNRNVKAEDIDKIIAAGNVAFAHSDLHFTVVTNPLILDKLDVVGKQYMQSSGIRMFTEAAAKPNFKIFDGAPVVILISSPQSENKIFENMNLTNAGFAVENRKLAAFALELGACYKPELIFGFGRADVKRLVGIPDGDVVYSVLVVGYTEDTKAPSTRPPAKNVRYVR